MYTRTDKGVYTPDFCQVIDRRKALMLPLDIGSEKVEIAAYGSQTRVSQDLL